MEHRKTFVETSAGNGCDDCGDGDHEKKILILVPSKKGKE
jgi:hypothetical protein